MSYCVIFIAVGLPCGQVNGLGNCNNLSIKLSTSSFVNTICAFTAALHATVAINFSSFSCFAVLATVFISSNVSKNKSFVSKSMHTVGTPVNFIVFSPNSSNINPAFSNISIFSFAISISLCVSVIISGNRSNCESFVLSL